ncbi:BnaCnng77570D, partial [Brassica napus]
MFLWAEFRDPRFYPSSCESLPSIATIGGLTEAARLGTLPRRIQITSKRRLSFSTGVHNVIEFLSDDSPDMDVIRISDNLFSDINKPA